MVMDMDIYWYIQDIQYYTIDTIRNNPTGEKIV